MKVTISKALKQKNRTAQQIAQLQNLIIQHNSRLVGSDPGFDLRAKLVDLENEVEKLVQIKAAISLANAPVQADIYRIAELKGRVAMWRQLETKSGRQLAPYMIQEPQDYEVTFTAVEVEEQVSRIEQEIDDLQDNLDQFNSTSQIEIPD
jgi:hypothetical protein